MDYYNTDDIQLIIGCKKSFAYELIRTLNRSLLTEYPKAKTIKGKIPKWYFEEKMVNKRCD